MFFQPRRHQTPLYPNMRPSSIPPQGNMYYQPVSPPSPIPMIQQKKQIKMPQKPRARQTPPPIQQPVKMFAPPGVEQSVQGFNPLINGNPTSSTDKREQGILSKLFGNTTRTVAGGGATAAATGVNIVSSLNTVLDNVQKANQIAKNVKPAVDRFSPMVKNLPNLLKIYTEVNKSPAEEKPSSNPVEKNETQLVSNKKNITKQKESIVKGDPSIINSSKKNPPNSNGPKLYI